VVTIALLATLAAVIAGVVRKQRSPNASMRKQLRAAPRVKIAELPESQVCAAVGRTRPLEMSSVMEAPLTGRPCFYFIAEIEERVGSQWRLVARERRGVPFVIQDATGRAVIDPEEALIDIPCDYQNVVWGNPSQRQHAFVLRLMPTAVTLPFAKQVRFREARIGPDELVSVLGAGVREADPLAPPAAEYRGDPVTRLRFSRAAGTALLVSAAEETIGLPDAEAEP
jgi:hypothetical protein